MDTRPKTIFLDIDGCIFKHRGSPSHYSDSPPELLPGAKEKLDAWEAQGARIILTTGRKESMREQTVAELRAAGVNIYDMLIMGLGGGPRYVINDEKPDGRPTAVAINICRDRGLADVEL